MQAATSKGAIPSPARREPRPAARPAPGEMQMSLRELPQLFSRLDPSPISERDLDGDAEEYLVECVEELPPKVELSLDLHLQVPPDPEFRRDAVTGLRNYFAQRERVAAAELRGLLRKGRASLVIGLAFLMLCFLASEGLAEVGGSLTVRLLSESLSVAGWVAMWRPLEIFLYDWWPLRRRRLNLGRLARLRVEMHAV